MSMTGTAVLATAAKEVMLPWGKPRRSTALFVQSGPQIGCSAGDAVPGSVNPQ